MTAPDPAAWLAALDATNVALLGVRRWGEDGETPVAIDGRSACGTWSDHHDRGCIAIHFRQGRGSQLLHLTSADALRLSDLLRAMAEANA